MEDLRTVAQPLGDPSFYFEMSVIDLGDVRFEARNRAAKDPAGRGAVESVRGGGDASEAVKRAGRSQLAQLFAAALESAGAADFMAEAAHEVAEDVPFDRSDHVAVFA